MYYTPSATFSDPALVEELQRIAQAIERLRVTPQILVRNSPPPKPFDGQVLIADGVNWNPIGDGVKRPVWYDIATETWKKYDLP